METTVTVNWYNTDETAVIFTFASRWTLDDLYQALDTGYAMQDSKAPQPISLILDARQARMIPRNIVPAAQYAARHRRSNSPQLFVLTSSALFKGMADFLARLSPDDYKTVFFVETEADLQAALQG